MQARLARTNGKLQEVTLVPNHFGLGHDGYKFPDGIIFRVDDCTDVEVKNPPRRWIHHDYYKGRTRVYKCDKCKFETMSYQVFHKHKRENNH